MTKTLIPRLITILSAVFLGLAVTSSVSAETVLNLAISPDKPSYYVNDEVTYTWTVLDDGKVKKDEPVRFSVENLENKPGQKCTPEYAVTDKDGKVSVRCTSPLPTNLEVKIRLRNSDKSATFSTFFDDKFSETCTSAPKAPFLTHVENQTTWGTLHWTQQNETQVDDFALYMGPNRESLKIVRTMENKPFMKKYQRYTNVDQPAANTQLYFQMRSINGCGESALSNIISYSQSSPQRAPNPGVKTSSSSASIVPALQPESISATPEEQLTDKTASASTTSEPASNIGKLEQLQKTVFSFWQSIKQKTSSFFSF